MGALITALVGIAGFVFLNKVGSTGPAIGKTGPGATTESGSCHSDE
jgi:hypothetical protein